MQHPTDVQAAYVRGQLDAYTRLLAEVKATVRAIEAEIGRLNPPPLPSRAPAFPQGPQGGEAR